MQRNPTTPNPDVTKRKTSSEIKHASGNGIWLDTGQLEVECKSAARSSALSFAGLRFTMFDCADSDADE